MNIGGINMKTDLSKSCLICFFLISQFIFLPVLVYAEGQRVRVITENATIRMNPSVDSEIIETPSKGREFEVVSVTGEWYEIKFHSRIGIAIFGYIQKKDVEPIKVEEKIVKEIQAEPVQEVKTVTTPPQSFAQEKAQTDIQIELVASGGVNLGYGFSKSLDYTRSFSTGVLQSANENGNLSQEMETPLGYGGALNIILDKGFGFQVRMDMNTEVKISGSSTYELTWQWSGVQNIYSRDNEWDITGKLTSMVFSGNVIFKPFVNDMFAPIISGGFSYFSGKLIDETNIGYAYTWLVQVEEDLYTRYIDYWSLPAKINASTNGVGFNIGGGADILISPKIGINIDARYFFKTKDQIPWDIATGLYYSEILNMGLNLDSNWAKEVLKNIPAFELNQSFFKFSMGIVLVF